MTHSTSRRALLRAGAAAAGLAGASGCLELLPPMGQRIRYGRVDAPGGDDPTYRRWVPAETAIQEDHDFFPDDILVATPADDGSDLVGDPVGIGRSFVAGMTDYFGIGIEHYDLVVGASGTMALEGPVDVDTVRGTLRSSGYGEAGSYEGYELFDRTDGPRTTAVADGRIVHASGHQHRRNVEAVIDAGEGLVERQHAVDRDFGRVTERAGLRPFLLGGDSENVFDTEVDPRFGLAAFDFDESAVYTLAYALYPEGVDVPEDEIRADLRDRDSALLSNAVDVETDGQVAIVETSVSHEAALEELTESYPPHATWGADETADELTLRHEAGESVPADELEILANWDDPTDTQFADEHDAVAPGTELSIPRSELSEPPIVILWRAPDESATATLFRYEFE